MRNTMIKLANLVILMIVGILAAGFAAAWPSADFTVPATAVAGEQFTVSYCAYGNDNLVQEVGVIDVTTGARSFDVSLSNVQFCGSKQFTETAAGNYTFVLQVVDSMNTTMQTMEFIEILPDTVAPAAVTGLAVEFKTNESITWSWTNPADDDLNYSLIKETVTILEDATIKREVNELERTIGVEDTVSIPNSCGVMVDGTVAWIDKGSSETINDVYVKVIDVTLNPNPATNTCLLELGFKSYAPFSSYMQKGLNPSTSYTIGITTVDKNDNVNNNAVTNTASTDGNPDTTIPGAITGLSATAITNSSITWSWTNPTDADFSKAIVLIDNVNVANVTAASYQATNLALNSTHKIGLKTADASGNVNTNVVENTATTLGVQTPDFTITNAQINAYKAGSAQGTFTIANTGSKALNTFTLVHTVTNDYSPSMGSAAALAVGASEQVTFTITVPSNFTIGTKTIGTVNVTAEGITKQANVVLVINGALEFTQIDALKVDDFTAVKDLQSSQTPTITVKPGSKFKMQLTIKNNGNSTIKDIDVEGVIADINDGDDMDAVAKRFNISSGNDGKAVLEFNISNEIVANKNYTMKITAEGEDASGKDNKQEFSLTVKTEKDEEDARITSVSFAKEVVCNADTTLKVTVMNTGLDSEKVKLKVSELITGLNVQTQEQTLSDENSKYTFDIPITMPTIYVGKQNSYQIVVNAMVGSKTYDSYTAVLETKECAATAQPRIPAAPAQSAQPKAASASTQSEKASDSLSAGLLSSPAGFVTSDLNGNAGLIGGISNLIDSMSGIDTNTALLIGGAVVGVLGIVGTVSFFTLRRKRDIFY